MIQNLSTIDTAAVVVVGVFAVVRKSFDQYNMYLEYSLQEHH